MSLKNTLLSLLSGILLWLAWPTFGFPALLFVAFVPLLLVERSLRTGKEKGVLKKIWLFSYLTFVFWNFCTTYWLYFSTPFGMYFAVLVNALIMSLVFMAYHFVARKTTQGAALTFMASLWILFEYLHLHWDFSWPWLNLGNGFSEYVNWVQWYEYTGTFGGTLWVWIVNISIFLAVLRFRESKINTTILLKKLLIPLVLVLLPVGLSYAILSGIEPHKKENAVEVLVIQPNFDPYDEKFVLDNTTIMDSVIKIAKSHLESSTDLIVTPETVLSGDMRISQLELDQSVANLRNLLSSYPDVSYLGGVSLLDVFKEEEKSTTQTNYYPDGDFYYNVYNSAMFLNAETPIELYHKSKLVVGVENFPYKSILQPILGDVMLDLGGTIATKTTQTDRAVFKTNDSTATAPIICYESVYGEYVTDYVKNGAQLLAIITNDGWWGDTQGHKQHLSLARLRAIENRRWVARSANTGISAIIDPAGKVVQRIEYEERGAITATVYKNNTLTFYSTHGDYIVRIAGFMALFVLGFTFLKRGTMKRK
jgi:apolipoprotein N-acyltransferase